MIFLLAFVATGSITVSVLGFIGWLLKESEPGDGVTLLLLISFLSVGVAFAVELVRQWPG